MQNPSHKPIVKLCSTGIVATREQSPHLPLSPEEIIRTALRCAELGVAILHIHARDEDGNPAWQKDYFARIIAGIRQENEEVIISVSTSGRLWSEFEKRADCLSLNGGLQPDMASLTLGSLNFARGESVNSPETIRRLAETMRERGIKPELDVFEPGMAHTAVRLIEEGVIDSNSPYFSLILGSLGTSPFTPAILTAFHSLLPAGAVWSAGGIGRTQLKANVASLAFGGSVRVGLEDNLYLDKSKGHLATNEQLVERLAGIAAGMGIEFASAAEARAALGLSHG